MNNTFGRHLTLTLFGESHGDAIGAVLDGIAPGIPVDPAFIAAQLSLRRPTGAISTARQEADAFKIISGVYEGYTTGTPLCVLIPNTEAHSADYAALRDLARPGHADYTARVKYHGFEDPRGGGHFSGRITAAPVAAGAILIGALRARGIFIGTHIASCAGIEDIPFPADPTDALRALADKPFAVLDDARGTAMREAILAAAGDGDSVGGVLESAVVGVPAGIGEPWFDTVEGLLSHALFSIPAVKGVQFGAGFDLAGARGSEFNDPFRMKDGRVETTTNHNGGILGGITNGIPITFRTAIKPTPSIFKPQETVNLADMTDATLSLAGRHDPAIIHRARVVVDSVTALVLADLLIGRFGTDWLAGDTHK